MLAVAYYRTSSMSNVTKAEHKGTIDEKDSERRQREAIYSFAERTGLSVMQEFADPGVSGADPIDARAGFSALLRWCAENNVPGRV